MIFKISVTPHLRKRAASAKNGTIYIRVTVGRLSVYFNTGEAVPVNCFDKKRKRIIKLPLAEKLNDLITSESINLHRKILYQKIAGLPITIEWLQTLKQNEVGKTKFADLVNEYKKVKNLSPQRIRHYNVTIHFWESLKLPEHVEIVTTSHIIKFREHVQLTNKHNGTLSHMVRLNTIFTYALDKQIISVHPMAKMKLGTWQMKRDFLTADQVKSIIAALPQMNNEQRQIAYMFLFQIFTGLRFSDAIAIEPKLIEKEGENTYLHWTMQKGKTKERVPLLSKAVALLPYVLNVKYSNAYYNRQLKEIAKLAGIKKNVTSHLARHTFATIALNSGIKVEVVQKLLGHTKIQTTMGYAHLMDSTKLTELLKFHN